MRFKYENNKLLLITIITVNFCQSAEKYKIEQLHAAAARGNKTEVEKLLKDPSLDSDSKDYCRQTALILASMNGHFDTVKLLLDRKVDINRQDFLGRTALLHASKNGYLKVVMLLLDNNADITIQDINGETASDVASWKRHDEILNFLCTYQDRYLPYREKCIQEKPALKKNVEESLTLELPADLIKIVLDYHGERCLTFSEFIKAAEEDKILQLQTAAFRGNITEVEKLLKDPSLDPDSKDLAVQAALLWAKRNKHFDIVKLLEGYI